MQVYWAQCCQQFYIMFSYRLVAQNPGQHLSLQHNVRGSLLVHHVLLSSGDIELVQLRRRLRETEAVMERIVEQMAKVPLKMQVCEGPLPIHCTHASFASHRILFFFFSFMHVCCLSSVHIIPT